MASDLVHHGQSFDDQPLGFGTLAIHLGNGVDAGTGAIRRPITLANAYALPYDRFRLANENPDCSREQSGLLTFARRLISRGWRECRGRRR